MTIAYIRVYSNKGSDESQQKMIMDFAESRHIVINKWNKEIGNSPRNNRKIENIVKNMNTGDQLIISDISRLSFKLMEIVKLIIMCMERKIILYSINEGYTFKDDANSKTLAFTFGLVSEIERKLVSIRTKEALAYTRGKGTVLGRPKGSPQMERLMPYKNDIEKDIQNKDASYQELAQTYKVSLLGFRRFVKEFLSTPEEEETVK